MTPVISSISIRAPPRPRGSSAPPRQAVFRISPRLTRPATRNEPPRNQVSRGAPCAMPSTSRETCSPIEPRFRPAPRRVPYGQAPPFVRRVDQDRDVSTLPERLSEALGAAYTFERELGGGGMARVFVAVEKRFDRRVVVKVLASELAAGVSAERFAREVALAARLQQANIVPVFDSGEFDGLPYYTMPWIEGESLRARLDARGALPIAETVAIVADVARALSYAHAHGVVHRDVKPENVLLSGHTAVVTDFGIAKAITAARTIAPFETLTQVGT